MLVSVAGELWDDGRACGQTYRVVCLGATNEQVPAPCLSPGVVLAIVARYCEDCEARKIVLSKDAFKAIADERAASACPMMDNSATILMSVGGKLWDNGKACGQSYLVECNGSKIKGHPSPCVSPGYILAKVVDNCGDCGANKILLSRNAFEAIAVKEASEIKVLIFKIETND
ncbi:hypothetical protein HPP92_013742 [Vanilla planifolia]|uniref:Expansin-like EG45 domain-containing protein n=1 Tax=Vanilla planifolia TaxID=51239 RepID=A0A835QW51_VANPL|nr:hypothetical protein HPP92_026463 [Vanilla planifolia]KAG0479023.1 hypothetical protein HPP92_013742 [Vanilla planifolia]